MVKPRLVLILGDQLSPNLSALRAADKSRDLVVMAEVSYVDHHVKKIAFLFAAMRKFAARLRADGWRVAYGRIDDPETGPTICAELLRRAEEVNATEVLTTQCGEWRLRAALQECPLILTVLPDDRFIATSSEFAAWAAGRPTLRLEFFYRDMRRKTGLLMEGDKPAGGRWNFDPENRKPARRDLFMPQPLRITPDAKTEAILDMVEARFPHDFDRLRPFWLATDAEGAEAAAAHFFAHSLPGFGGDHQDAMLAGERFLHHAVLSPYLNAGLLDPLDLCRRAEAEFRPGRAPLNAVEGFMRRILGWREFVRGIYDLAGPDYASRNHLRATCDLPGFCWTAETEIACVRETVTQTIEDAYAHHIQRLMVTGNFALIAGIDPHQLHVWYLEVYADAFEWVEAPNTIGMSQFADGGLLGSKPYAASGVYIDRMSDHCSLCRYDVKALGGEGACPFNPLYWDFLERNRDRLGSNPRMIQTYRNWDRLSADQHAESLDAAAAILARLDACETI